MKKLNNRGWGLQAMMICVLVLMIALVIIAVLIQKTFGDMLNINGEPSTSINSNKNNTDKNDNKNDNKNDKNEKPTKLTYSDLENKVTSAAKKYQKENYDDILDGEQISVTVKTLKREKLLEDIKDAQDSKTSCTGYALFKRKNDEITYKAYIKCNNYTTDGYMEYLDI